MIWQFVINGLITGILYSLLAIGFALAYNTTWSFHITAAVIYVFSAYMFWLLVAKASIPVLLAAAVTIIAAQPSPLDLEGSSALIKK